MESWLVAMIAAGATIMGSSGLWAYLQSRDKTQTANSRLLLGVARGQIISTGMAYIQRGFITHDEYDDFDHYLYKPYSELGGNGLAEKVMAGVKDLPFSAAESPIVQTLKEKRDG